MLLFLVMVFPVYWMVSTAFKPDQQVNSLTPTWFSLRPTLVHFGDAIHKPFFWVDVKNSLIVVSVTVVVAMVLAFLAAVAWRKHPLHRPQALHPSCAPSASSCSRPQGDHSALRRARQVSPGERAQRCDQEIDVRAAVLHLDAARFHPRIPKDLEEAAMVDGSTRLGAFVKILLPLVAPGLVATSVFAFITRWNEYIWAERCSTTSRGRRSRSGSRTSSGRAGTPTGAR